jgi:hypothetical protein
MTKFICKEAAEMLDQLMDDFWDGKDDSLRALPAQLACEIVATEFDYEENSEEMYELQVRAGV